MCSEHTYLYLFDFGRFFLTRPGEAGEGAVSKGRHGTEVSGVRGTRWRSKRDGKDSISDQEQ